MDKRHWMECPSSLTHGNIIQRVIFTREDPGDPRKAGAVLRFIDSFARGFLEAGVSSVPHVNEGIQEVFFVAEGAGSLATPAGVRRLREGDGVLIPPGIEHTLAADGDQPLELLLLVECVPPGTAPRAAAPVVRNYRESRLGVGHGTHFLHRILGADDGLLAIHNVLIVRIEPMQTPESHGHGADMDEVWYMWRGRGVHVVGAEVCVQTPGTAVSVCPSRPGHILINHTDQPLQAFYFAHYAS